MRIQAKIFSVLAAGGLLTALASAQADPAPEYALKAAFIYNFATFTEWPAQPRETLHLCILGNESFGNALGSIEGKLVNNARLMTKHVPSTEQMLRGCQIVFIGASEKDRLPAILATARDASILTITDMEGAAQQGVMIGMSMEQKKITFEINLEAARRARLNISSKLLRLAKAVY